MKFFRLLSVAVVLSLSTFTSLASLEAHSAWLIKERVGIEILSIDRSPNEPTTSQRLVLRDAPEHVIEGADGGTNHPKARTLRYRESLVAEFALTENERRFLTRQAREPRVVLSLASEVRTLVEQGPPSNRIDLTFVGDGYTEAEREKFFADVKRQTDELFQGQTFAPYLSLFNVHAVFVPSAESGISDRVKKNTAFGLYRTPVGSRRAIMPGNTRAIEAALRLAPGADYPILIANDDGYGGLGGRYAISTRSLESGSMVLRHELGHNFGNVGEEYDGGQVYDGANFSATTRPGWMPWLTSGAAIHEALFLKGAYVWQPLASNPFRTEFVFPGPAATSDLKPLDLHVDLSAVGFDRPDAWEVLLDGQPVGVTGQFTSDRSFFELETKRSLAPGKHVLEVREKIRDGDNVLAFANIYAIPQSYDTSAGTVALFTVYNDSGQKVGYRPTHKDCLMRNMRGVDFCAADLENMWNRFLARVSLIDSLSITRGSLGQVQVVTPGLRDLRIRWFEKVADGSLKEIEAFRGEAAFPTQSVSAGSYRVVVEFETPQVRNRGPFSASRDFTL